MAGGAEGLAGALRDAVAILESVYRSAPTRRIEALLERMFAGEGIYLYAHQQQTTDRAGGAKPGASYFTTASVAQTTTLNWKRKYSLGVPLLHPNRNRRA